MLFFVHLLFPTLERRSTLLGERFTQSFVTGGRITARWLRQTDVLEAAAGRSHSDARARLRGGLSDGENRHGRRRG